MLNSIMQIAGLSSAKITTIAYAWVQVLNLAIILKDLMIKFYLDT